MAFSFCCIEEYLPILFSKCKNIFCKAKSYYYQLSFVNIEVRKILQSGHNFGIINIDVQDDISTMQSSFYNSIYSLLLASIFLLIFHILSFLIAVQLLD